MTEEKMGRKKDRVGKDRIENRDAKVEAREGEMRICGGRKKERLKNERKNRYVGRRGGRNKRREGGEEVGEGR